MTLRIVIAHTLWGSLSGATTDMSVCALPATCAATHSQNTSEDNEKVSSQKYCLCECLSLSLSRYRLCECAFAVCVCMNVCHNVCADKIIRVCVSERKWYYYSICVNV